LFLVLSVALGACIGLLVGLAQVLLKEAWIRVEAGFRPGRELILGKEKTSIGRAEGSDIPLFGDNAVEKLHAHIVRSAGRFFLEEAGPTQGTYVNGHRIAGRCLLASGDLIRIGKSVLRFSERRKRLAA
jgi:pSer/pThr/pTyr-binding forkhead associated (FHA) protein